MRNCYIIGEAIEESECNLICEEAKKEGKTNKTTVPKKIKRIVCWKGICKTCKYHS